MLFFLFFTSPRCSYKLSGNLFFSLSCINLIKKRKCSFLLFLSFSRSRRFPESFSLFHFMFRALLKTTSSRHQIPRLSVIAGSSRRTLVTGKTTAKPKHSRRRKIGYAAGTTTLLGTFSYLMTQDYLFLEEAKGAHEQVPFLALHPERGGAKNLPVVTHQLDDLAEDEEKPRLVIVGSGWGAVSVLRNLEKDKFNVTIISPNNYFLFTPLLPSVCVGTNEPR